jgi:Ca-activated chloride channel family protein
MSVMPASVRLRRWLLCAGLLLLALTAAVRPPIFVQAQQKPPQSGTEKPPAEAETIRIGTALVTLSVGVFDKQGQPVSHLTEPQFEVYEDGQRQMLAFFGQEDLPISFGLLLDHSDSMGEVGKLQQVQEAALAFLRAGNPQNEAFGFAFNETAKQIFDFTSDYQKIAASFSGIQADGGTALYDAIIQALEKLEPGKHRRRALVVITDGRDEHSRHKLADLLRRTQQTEAQIYFIGFFSRLETAFFHTSGAKVSLIDGREVDNPVFIFKTLAEETGGQAFFPHSAAEMERAIAEIAAHLRRQYTLAYYPPNQSEDDRYHKLQVKIAGGRSDWQIRTRQGYRMKGPESGETPATAAESADTEPGSSAALPDEPGPAMYRETFDDPASGWPSTEKMFYQKGKYQVRGSRIVPVKNYVYADFDAALTAEMIGGGERSGSGSFADTMTLPSAGLSFRISPVGYYLFVIAPAPSKQYGFYRLLKVGWGQEIELIPWRQDTAIRGRNLLRVRCAGTQIEIYVNQRRLASLTDATHREGRMSLVLAGEHAGLDNVEIKKIE